MSIDASEVRVQSASGASKGQKDARFDLIPPRALRQVATHYGLGARKYPGISPVDGTGPAIDNWRLGFNYSSSLAALHRHLNAWSTGEDIDEETGSPHLAAVVWHALTLMEYQLTPGYPEAFDDRQQSIVGREGFSADEVRAAHAAYGGELPSAPIPTQLPPLPSQQ